MTEEPSMAKTRVFWNIDDCPIPDGLDPRMIFENIKSALANEGYDHGVISISSYCDKNSRSFDKLSSLADTSLVTIDHCVTFKHIFKDIFSWVLQNRYLKTIRTVLLISKIPQDWKISLYLNTLRQRGYSIVLAVPDALAYVSCVWLWPALTNKLNIIDDQRGSLILESVTNQRKRLHVAKTGVFWNIQDFTIPEVLLPHIVNRNIKSALANSGYRGDVSIWAYSDRNPADEWVVSYYSASGITLQKKVVKINAHVVGPGHCPEGPEVNQMLVDVLLWALDNPAPSNLLIISKDISEETELLSLLRALESKGYNILAAQTEEAASTVLACTASSEWLLKNLFAGGVPIDLSGNSRHVASNTSILWDIEDCPVPYGFDPRLFVQLIKSALANHGCVGEVSISAYCENEKYRSLNDFTLTDITLVPTGDKSARSKKMLIDILFCALEYQKASNVILITKDILANIYDVRQALNERGVKVLNANPWNRYAMSVWLWPSLAGGGTCSDYSLSS